MEEKKKRSIIELFKNLDKKRKILIIIIFILLLILIGLTIYYFISKDDKKEPVVDPVKIEVIDNYAYSDGILLLYDSDKKEIGKYTCNNKDESLCYVSYLSNEDIFTIIQSVDENKEKIDIRSELYLNQYAFIYDNTDGENIIILYDFINEEKKGSYTVIKTGNVENSVILKNVDGKYGIITFDEDNIETIIDFEYDYLGVITEDKEDSIIIAKKNGNYYLIDNNNKTLTKSLKNQIVNYNDKYILTINTDGIYSVYDYSANLIVENYVYIQLLDEYLIVVDDSNKLMVLDYENSKYLGEGIQLKNKNYIKTNVYNKELEKTDTLYSFTYTLIGSNLNIYVLNNDSEVEYVIDLNEGKYNKDLTYSYFDGKLYFYTDNTKSELIGYYNCKNDNVISENMINCSTNISTSTDNNVLFDKYVIILDVNSSDASAVKYYLYDIKESKLKGNFIDFFIDGDANTVIGSSPVNFFAISKSEKTGVLKISKDGIDNFIKLENDDVRRYGDYYLVENSTKYILKDLNGISILSTPFTYIDIADNYFVVINEDSLLLYDYTGKQLIDSAVTINTKLYQFESYNISTIYKIEEKSSYYLIDNFAATENKHYFNKNDGSILAEADALLLEE